jgi:hypothetical protein
VGAFIESSSYAAGIGGLGFASVRSRWRVWTTTTFQIKRQDIIRSKTMV